MADSLSDFESKQRSDERGVLSNLKSSKQNTSQRDLKKMNQSQKVNLQQSQGVDLDNLTPWDNTNQDVLGIVGPRKKPLKDKKQMQTIQSTASAQNFTDFQKSIQRKTSHQEFLYTTKSTIKPLESRFLPSIQEYNRKYSQLVNNNNGASSEQERHKANENTSIPDEAMNGSMVVIHSNQHNSQSQLSRESQFEPIKDVKMKTVNIFKNLIQDDKQRLSLENQLEPLQWLEILGRNSQNNQQLQQRHLKVEPSSGKLSIKSIGQQEIPQHRHPKTSNIKNYNPRNDSQDYGKHLLQLIHDKISSKNPSGSSQQYYHTMSSHVQRRAQALIPKKNDQDLQKLEKGIQGTQSMPEITSAERSKALEECLIVNQTQNKTGKNDVKISPPLTGHFPHRNPHNIDKASNRESQSKASPRLTETMKLQILPNPHQSTGIAVTSHQLTEIQLPEALYPYNTLYSSQNAPQVAKPTRPVFRETRQSLRQVSPQAKKNQQRKKPQNWKQLPVRDALEVPILISTDFDQLKQSPNKAAEEASKVTSQDVKLFYLYLKNDQMDNLVQNEVFLNLLCKIYPKLDINVQELLDDQSQNQSKIESLKQKLLSVGLKKLGKPKGGNPLLITRNQYGQQYPSSRQTGVSVSPKGTDSPMKIHQRGPGTLSPQSQIGSMQAEIAFGRASYAPAFSEYVKSYVQKTQYSINQRKIPTKENISNPSSNSTGTTQQTNNEQMSDGKKSCNNYGLGLAPSQPTQDNPEGKSLGVGQITTSVSKIQGAFPASTDRNRKNVMRTSKKLLDIEVRKKQQEFHNPNYQDRKNFNEYINQLIVEKKLSDSKQFDEKSGVSGSKTTKGSQNQDNLFAPLVARTQNNFNRYQRNSPTKNPKLQICSSAGQPLFDLEEIKRSHKQKIQTPGEGGIVLGGLIKNQPIQQDPKSRSLKPEARSEPNEWVSAFSLHKQSQKKQSLKEEVMVEQQQV